MNPPSDPMHDDMHSEHEKMTKKSFWSRYFKSDRKDDGTAGRHDPFALETEGGVQYKSMTWWQGGMVMVAETISLGILSLPSALSVLGLIPGIIMIVFLGILAWYSGFVIGQFKIAYPHVHSMADAGDVLLGRVGYEILGAAQLTFYIFCMGSHILTFSIMMNAIAGHSTCTIVWMVIGFALSLVLTLPRTLKHMSYYSIASFVSIGAAVLTTMVGVAVAKPIVKLGTPIALWCPPGVQFYQAFLAVANIIFSYAGHVAFFSFISELKDPREFPRSLAVLQCNAIAMYVATGVVIYYYAGAEVASPALDSAPSTVRKVAYGLAMPTIVVSGVVNGHVAVKYLYVRLFRDYEQNIIQQKTLKARAIWASICAVLWILAWIIAEGVPIFNDLLGLCSALFGGWFSFGLCGMFWMQMNKGHWFENPRNTFLFGLNGLNIVVGACVCFMGLYASIKDISINTARDKPFSCSDNSDVR